MTEESPIQVSGVAIRLDPQKMESVKGQLNTITDLEIHVEDQSGKLVITLENRNSHQMTDTIKQLEEIDGVRIVNPVYIHDEEEMVKASR